MSTITEMAERWQFVVDNIIQLTGAVLQEHEQEVLDINRAQLHKGMGSDGSMLQKYDPDFSVKVGGSSIRYKALKESMNPHSAGRYDMFFSGDSYNRMRLVIDGPRYQITGEGFAKAYHDGTIMNGVVRDRIYGLYENDHMEYFRRQYLYPELRNQIKMYTGVE